MFSNLWDLLNHKKAYLTSQIVVWTKIFILRYIINNKLNVEFPACTAIWIHVLLFATFLFCHYCYLLFYICWFSQFLRIVCQVLRFIYNPFNLNSKYIFSEGWYEKTKDWFTALLTEHFQKSCRYQYKSIGGFFFYRLFFNLWTKQCI